MEPLSPNDPVFKLLGKTKQVEPRPNFTQNVLRAVRQTPQRETWWERCQSWLAHGFGARSTWAGSGLAVTTALAIWLGVRAPEVETPPTSAAAVATATPFTKETTSTGALAAASLEEETFTAVEESTSVASQLASMDQMSLLLAQQDTSALTDNEIALLLY
ncbi:hypothetical protein [Verrucomicrobium spinosum]|uniref:hypothetical protein n=1 Tax=Verrucomicrobium spinosum TaxID=2736 RepID=UPI00017466C2|nr:hypothetical protein [Verrucomicrobium spinosum]